MATANELKQGSTAKFRSSEADVGFNPPADRLAKVLSQDFRRGKVTPQREMVIVQRGNV